MDQLATALTAADHRGRLVERSALVQGRDHLSAARQGVLRFQRRRHGRLPGPDREARLHQGPRRQHDLAAAVLSLAAARRRLRHRRLPQRQSAVRHARRLPALRARGASPRSAGDHRADHQPHLGPAPLVPGRAARADRARTSATTTSGATRRQVHGHAHHLHRHREIELGLGRGRAGVLLAPLLQPPAGSQLRQSAGAEGDLSGSCASGSTWAWTASGSMRSRTCASARAPATRTCPRRTRC